MEWKNLQEPNGNKVLVIGLDGATFDLIKPWVNEGKLPVFNELMNKGVYGTLISPFPSSAPAWSSIVTGKNPGKHNIFDFFTIKGYELEPVNARYRRSKAIWNFLNDYGKKAVVINLPISYPPEKINGIMISGMDTPETKDDFVHPIGLREYLTKENYEIECPFRDLLLLSENLLFKKIFSIIEKRAEIAMYLMKEYKWDFFMVVFTELDRIQHFFWRRKDVILKNYQKLGSVISRFLDIIDTNTDVIIVSDHGFGPLNKDFYINIFLMKLRLLELNKRKIVNNLLKLNLQNMLPLSRKLNLPLARWLPFQRLGRMLDLDNEFSLSVVKLPSTMAYCPSLSSQSIKINLKGRDPQGIVNPGEEYDKLRNYLIKSLLEFNDPETKNKPVEKVYRREEVFWGPFLEYAPDLFVRMRKGYSMHPALDKKVLLGEPEQSLGRRTGDHQPDGIFFAYGHNIKHGSIEKNLSIFDITPTILHMFGVPIPTDVDGNVLKEIFKEDSETARRPVIYELRAENKRIKERIRKLKVNKKF